jgi:phenylacetic acid degradation operon negative regulatory protein
VQARSAVFDLYGDHLADHGYWAPIAGVVTLTQSCGIQPPATRTAVSRMVAQRWLQPRTVGGQRGYAATQAAKDRLRRAHARIYDPGTTPWDGRWHVVVLDPPKDRTRRERLVSTMGYLGYGRLSPTTWVSPHRSAELRAGLEAAGVEWTDFHGPTEEDPVQLVQRVWDLEDLSAAYDEFTFDLPELGDVTAMDPAQAYPVRTELVHRWRKFMFRDPGLPAEVLPPTWPGLTARQRFLDVAADLQPAARMFVTEVLAQTREHASPTRGARDD